MFILTVFAVVVLLCTPTYAVTYRNGGLKWAIYNNTASVNRGTTYAQFDPTAYKKVTPIHSAITHYIGGTYTTGSSDDPISIYGSPAIFSPNEFVLNHRGYLHIRNTGTYTFNATNTDDIFFLWLGTKAYKSYDRNNSDCTASYGYPDGTEGTCSFTASYTAGQFVPMRLMYGQSDYGASLNFVIVDPLGNQILGPLPTLTKRKNVIRYGLGANRKKAPLFPAFGKE